MIALVFLTACSLVMQPPSRPGRQPATAASSVDSIVSSRTATYVRGDTLEIEGRGERKSPRKVFLILPDTVYQLVGGRRRPVPAIAAEAIRGTAANIRDLSRRGRQLQER
jgi:endonuclease YncB( thermonuclease family)